MPLPPLARCLAALVALTPALSAFAADAPAAPGFAAIPQKMQPFVDDGQVAGIVTLVATKDKILELDAVGKSDLASGRKMEPNDLFWIASMSKPMTAVAVAMLKDEGKLNFDDPVSKYLPEFQNIWLTQGSAREDHSLVRPPRPITIRDLMTHTSGLGEYAVFGPHWTLAEYSRVLSREPLRFAPGTRWSYSTAGFDTLGRIVEAVSGMPFETFMQKRLFDPLAMKDTTFWLSPEQQARYATPYRLTGQGRQLAPAPITYMYGTEITDRQRPPLGGAGLFSTASDVAKFYQMMLNNGMANGQPILKPETVTEMLTKQTGELRARPGMPWGLGFCVIEDPSASRSNAMLSAGSFGHGGAYGTQSWADPKSGIVYVMMLERTGLNTGVPDDSDMHYAFQHAAADALPKPQSN